MAGLEVRTKTRWFVRLKDAFGSTQQLVVQVRGGFVHTQVGELQSKLSPEDVSDLRQTLLEAQAEAFRQRGGWS